MIDLSPKLGDLMSIYIGVDIEIDPENSPIAALWIQHMTELAVRCCVASQLICVLTLCSTSLHRQGRSLIIGIP
jgi:hypothetical protein